MTKFTCGLEFEYKQGNLVELQIKDGIDWGE